MTSRPRCFPAVASRSSTTLPAVVTLAGLFVLRGLTIGVTRLLTGRTLEQAL